MTVALVILGVVLLGVLFAHERERHVWDRERRMLLQRIQAPELAVIEHRQDTAPEDVPAVGFDDDLGFWEARATR